MEIVPFDKCCGCGACYAVCTHEAIAIYKDDYGFDRPRIDNLRCVTCCRCKQVCPVAHPVETVKPHACYVARTKNERLLLRSSSGGVFAELSLSIIAKGGVVFGAGWSCGKLRVIHRKAETVEELGDLMGAKYVQSDMNGIYDKVRAAAMSGRPVLFSGVPCQIAGMKRYLNGRFSNVIFVEIICHGVPSPAVFEQYVNDLQGRMRCNVSRVAFRYKQKDVPGTTFMVEYEDKVDRSIENLYHNPYGISFYKNLALRHSCYDCQFRYGKSGADITIGDYWGVEKHHKEFVDGKGTSLIILRNARCEILSDLDLLIEPTKYKWLLPKNPNLEKNPKVFKRRRRVFFENVFDKGVAGAVKLAMRKTLLECCTTVPWGYFRRLIGKILRLTVMSRR